MAGGRHENDESLWGPDQRARREDDRRVSGDSIRPHTVECGADLQAWLDLNDVIHEVLTLAHSEALKHRISLCAELAALRQRYAALTPQPCSRSPCLNAVQPCPCGSTAPGGKTLSQP